MNANIGRPSPQQSRQATDPRQVSARHPVNMPANHGADQRLDPLVQVETRFDFYRDGFRKLIWVAGGGVAVGIAGLIFGLCCLFLKPEPKYFPTGPGCVLRPLTPVTEPNVSDDDVIGYATKAALHAYSYDHLNWRQQFSDTSRFFTKDGWNSMLVDFDKTGNLKKVIDRRWIVSSVVQTAPAIVNQYVDPVTGVYTWVVAFDMSVLYRGEMDYPQKVRVEARVTRVPEDTVADGSPIRVNDIKSGLIG